MIKRMINVVFATLLSGNVVAMAEAPKTILLAQGESSFTITLPSNPTTGFVWLLESYDDHVLKVTKHDYVAPQVKNKVGAPGLEQWVFDVNTEIIGPRVTKVTLIHARPWEVGATTVEKKALTVVIQ